MSVKVQLVDIHNRAIRFDKRVGILKNGEDNAYSERMERFINNSVTAKTAANIMAAYICGDGFGEIDNKIVVGKKGDTLKKFSQKLAKSFAKQRGAYIHVNYTMNFDYASFDVLPYAHCRLGEKDDDRYNGKIGVSSKFTNDKLKEEDIQFIDVFNPKKSVIQAQLNRFDGTEKDKFDHYKGQIWYINLDDDYDYSLSTIDAVQNDCDSEAQASIFKNKSLRKGFFGKTLIITEPLIQGTSILDFPGTPEEYRIAQNEREEFKETIQDFIGAENVGGALHFEVDPKNIDGDLDKAILFKNIDSNIDDKIFEYTENSTFKNILMAFNNLPSSLVRSDNAMFGNSGESIKVMRQVYQENTLIERSELEETIQLLMRKFKTPKEVNLVPLIKDIVEVEEETKTIDDDTVKTDK